MAIKYSYTGIDKHVNEIIWLRMCLGFALHKLTINATNHMIRHLKRKGAAEGLAYGTLHNYIDPEYPHLLYSTFCRALQNHLELPL